MKKIIKYIIALTLIINVSCNSDNNEEYGKDYNSGWIEINGFDDTSNVLEHTINFDENIVILTKLNSGTNINGIEVTYNITLENGGFLDDQSILGTKTFMIEKGLKVGEIGFSPVLSSGKYTLKFTLVSTNDGEFQVGLSDDSQPIYFLLTVTNSFSYNATVSSYKPGFPDYVAKIGKIGGTTNQYSVDSSWGPNFISWTQNNSAFDGQFVNAGVITVNSDNTLTITGDYIASTGSVGTFDPGTGVFDVTFNETGIFNAGFPIQTVFTPQ